MVVMIRVIYKVWRPIDSAVISWGIGSDQKRTKRGQVKVPGKWDRLTEDFETVEEACAFAADAKDDGHRIVGIYEVAA